jgi:cellulose biosynthesis protein BcsQ
MAVVAVFNRKGGVGKTTTAVNIAAGIALHGRRTLLVDLDPQGSAGRALDVEVADGRGSSALFAAKGKPVVAYPAHEALFRLGVLPADPQLLLL